MAKGAVAGFLMRGTGVDAPIKRFTGNNYSYNSINIIKTNIDKVEY